MRHRFCVTVYLILGGMFPSYGFREEGNLGLGFVLKEMNQLVDKRQHHLPVILTGNVILLEVREAGQAEGVSPTGMCLAEEVASDQLQRTRW